MSENKNQFVLPGDTISGSYEPAQNVILDDNRLLSTAIGFCEINDNEANVYPLTGFYIPRSDDLVIGKITSHSAMSWEVNINSCYSGMLPATDVFGRDFSSHSDDLSSKLSNGDLIVARIVNADKTRDPLLTISGRELGKIDSGELMTISPSKVARLIGKRGSMIQMIESGSNAQITIGQNGLIVVACDDSDGLLKAVKAIELVEEKAHVANLTDQISEMLGLKSD